MTDTDWWAGVEPPTTSPANPTAQDVNHDLEARLTWISEQIRRSVRTGTSDATRAPSSAQSTFGLQAAQQSVLLEELGTTIARRDAVRGRIRALSDTGAVVGAAPPSKFEGRGLEEAYQQYSSPARGVRRLRTPGVGGLSPATSRILGRSAAGEIGRAHV